VPHGASQATATQLTTSVWNELKCSRIGTYKFFHTWCRGGSTGSQGPRPPVRGLAPNWNF